ncbi:MAG TPA: hypothetical protein VFQ53_24025 [Kofleriaceae bacterium]|nr:hypothetical protein [Kofleriaceae bacterium]
MRWFLVVLLAAACGENASPRMPDVDGGAPDPSDPAYAACAEFTGPGVIVPAHVEGVLAGADVTSPGTCAVTNAPFGVESAGPDRVISLRGLRTGQPYVVKVTSTSDLGFYVTTGCSTSTGPSSEQCLLFEDESLGNVELGRFVATGTSAFVVVDYYSSQAPSSADFMLDVYEEECADASQCDASRPACSDGLCVECETSFDCHDAAAPRCDDVAHQCTTGIDTCTTGPYGDDVAEPADDGPAGARVLALDATGRGVAAGAICASPLGESDFVAFDVTTIGEAWSLQLGWSGSRDLDLELFAADGTPLGMSFWEQPERVRLTYLPIGRYYARVREFASTIDPGPVSYTLLAQRTLGPGCTSATDCAAEFRNQLYRGRCEAGACVAIDGGGAIAEGGACDSQSDCGPLLHCPSFFFVAHADARDTCARGCSADADCAALGDFVCTTYLADNFCVPRCSSDAECPTSPGDEPTTGPWYRLRCDVTSGRCLP